MKNILEITRRSLYAIFIGVIFIIIGICSICIVNDFVGGEIFDAVIGPITMYIWIALYALFLEDLGIDEL